jgi:hypothetical protein
MIPNEIYLHENDLKEMCGFDGVGCFVHTNIDCVINKKEMTKYIRAPIAKRFADELPKDGELIMYRVLRESVWQQMQWRDLFNLPEINNFEWFPVILPTIEENKNE